MWTQLKVSVRLLMDVIKMTEKKWNGTKCGSGISKEESVIFEEQIQENILG